MNKPFFDTDRVPNLACDVSGVTKNLYPLTFDPIFKERVWGGRNLERLFAKKLPAEKVIGESWEVSDRPDDESIVNNGELAGMSLNQLIRERSAELLGETKLLDGRFPLLVKILDAQQKLSLQVHPPSQVASELQGDPKTEMWYMADCTPEADLFVGLKSGITEEIFESRTAGGDVASCFHRIPVTAGDAMFLPSGRVHAIGAGNVIFEIQQNSDTTYRVYDWGRVGLDGAPRELHIEESMRSIDFADFEPSLVNSGFEVVTEGVSGRCLVDCPLFQVEQIRIDPGKEWMSSASGKVRIIGALAGSSLCEGGGMSVPLKPGDFTMLPATIDAAIRSEADAVECLVATPA